MEFQHFSALPETGMITMVKAILNFSPTAVGHLRLPTRQSHISHSLTLIIPVSSILF